MYPDVLGLAESSWHFCDSNVVGVSLEQSEQYETTLGERHNTIHETQL